AHHRWAWQWWCADYPRQPNGSPGASRAAIQGVRCARRGWKCHPAIRTDRSSRRLAEDRRYKSRCPATFGGPRLVTRGRVGCPRTSSRSASRTIGSPRPHVEGRSEEHTSELQSRGHLVCRLLLEKKKQQK